jgi:hypothetical protein
MASFASFSSSIDEINIGFCKAWHKKEEFDWNIWAVLFILIFFGVVHLWCVAFGVDWGISNFLEIFWSPGDEAQPKLYVLRRIWFSGPKIIFYEGRHLSTTHLKSQKAT